MDRKTNEGLDDLLLKVENQEKTEQSHKSVSVLIIITLFLFLLIGLFQCASEITSLKSHFSSKFFADKEILTLQSVSNNTVLFLIKDSNKLSQMRIISNSTGNTFDLSSGVADVLTASLSHKGNLVSYIKNNENKLSLIIRDWRWQLETNSTSINVSNYSKHLFKGIEVKSITVCPWSTIRWSPDDSKMLFFVCSGGHSILVIGDVKLGKKLKSYYSTQSTSEIPRVAQWVSEDEVLFTEQENTRQIIKKIIINEEGNQSVVLYTLKPKL